MADDNKPAPTPPPAPKQAARPPAPPATAADTDAGRVRASFSTFKILLPVVIGLAVVVWLFSRDFNVKVWDSIHFDFRTVVCIALAWMCMVGRDFGLMWRFRALTDRQLSWTQALKVNVLCEFTTCVTPSGIGGSSLGMVFLHSQGIELGRATTLMITTLFLDELFFVVALPVIMLVIPQGELWGFNIHAAFSVGLKTVFWAVYAIVVVWTSILFVGILLRPYAVQRLLLWVFRFKPLRRWRPAVEKLGDNMSDTSKELRGKSARWWGENFLATTLTWTSRYLVVNALFLGFAPMADQLVVFGRQFIIWIVLMVSPTPGGAGVSEWLFTEYYGDMIKPGVALIIALFWRIITYYVYLVAGALYVPDWLKQTFGKPKKSTGT